MRTARQTLKRPARMIEKSSRKFRRRSAWSSLGIPASVMGALTVMAVASFLPELMRYVKIERM